MASIGMPGTTARRQVGAMTRTVFTAATRFTRAARVRAKELTSGAMQCLGLASFTAAGFTMSATIGLVVMGASWFTLEWLVRK